MDGNKLQDPRVSTQEYLEKHKINELIEGLLAELVYNKPQNPKQYIVTQLEKIKVAGTKPLLDKQDLHTMFRMFDVTQKGVVSEQQAMNALKTVLGSRSPAAAADSSAGTAPLAEQEFLHFMSNVLVDATPFCKADDGNETL